jgi:hypothetical protein
MALMKRLVVALGMAASLPLAHATDILPNETPQPPSSIEELLNNSELLQNWSPILTSSIAVPSHEVIAATTKSQTSAVAEEERGGYLYLILGCFLLGLCRAFQYPLKAAQNRFSWSEITSLMRHSRAEELRATPSLPAPIGSSGTSSRRLVRTLPIELFGHCTVRTFPKDTHVGKRI